MNKKIVYSVIIAALAFLIIMYLAREDAPAYQLSIEESLKDMVTPGHVVSIQDLDKFIADKGAQSHVVVDIRTPYDFVRGHIDKAINIPYNSMLSKENMAIFRQLQKEKTDVILYGNDQSQANAPCLLLRQMGYTNVRLLAGGYAAYMAPGDSLGNKPDFNAEKAACNYAGEMKKSKPQELTATTSPEKPKVKIVPVEKKTKAAEGGC